MGGSHPPPSENSDLSASELTDELTPVSKLEFVRCGLVEKKQEHSICLALVGPLFPKFFLLFHNTPHVSPLLSTFIIEGVLGSKNFIKER